MIGDTSFYSRLGIERDASQEDIRHAYREAARKIHPDVNVEEGATELFLNIKEAYEVLVDPGKREAYDKNRPAPPPPPIRLNTVYSREALHRLHDPQLIYALVELDVLMDVPEDEGQYPPVNLCLVLDCSTSMKDARLEVLKNTAIEILRQMRPQDILSVVAFNDRADVLIPAGPRPNFAIGEGRIRSILARGGTELYQGLKAGYLEARRFLNSSYSNHLVLITDGHTYGDDAKCLELADKAAGDGLEISCLGIGHEWNDVLLDSMAKSTGGSSIFVSRSKDIQHLLQQKFEGIGNSYVERVNLDFNLIPGVDLKYAYRLNPEVGSLPNTPPINLGGIPHKSRQRILLEFVVEPLLSTVNRVVLAEGRFTFQIPKFSRDRYRLPITLMRPVTDARQMEPPPHQIVEAMSKLTLYRMQEKAKDNVAAGEIGAAVENLQNLATNLLAQGEVELAKTVIFEAQNIKNQQKLSREGEKQIKYGTRALLLPSGQ